VDRRTHSLPVQRLKCHHAGCSGTISSSEHVSETDSSYIFPTGSRVLHHQNIVAASQLSQPFQGLNNFTTHLLINFLIWASVWGTSLTWGFLLRGSFIGSASVVYRRNTVNSKHIFKENQHLYYTLYDYERSVISTGLTTRVQLFGRISPKFRCFFRFR